MLFALRYAPGRGISPRTWHVGKSEGGSASLFEGPKENHKTLCVSEIPQVHVTEERVATKRTPAMRELRNTHIAPHPERDVTRTPNWDGHSNIDQPAHRTPQNVNTQRFLHVL